MTKEKGTLYLIPSPLSEAPVQDVLPQALLDTLPKIHRFVVEEIRTARRFLSRAGLKGHIDSLTFYELNEHTDAATVEGYLSLFEDGCDVGLISEAGLPAVADPGAALVALCQKKGIRVHPFAGPSSLMLALMSSGLNGQCFAFAGYLPAKTDERKQALKALEKRSASQRETEIFIETPYRSDALLGDLLCVCSPHTRLCLAVNLTAPDEDVRTKTIEQWKKEKPVVGKRPCVFLMLA